MGLRVREGSDQARRHGFGGVSFRQWADGVFFDSGCCMAKIADARCVMAHGPCIDFYEYGQP